LFFAVVMAAKFWSVASPDLEIIGTYSGVGVPEGTVPELGLFLQL
jgi:hypothetical protein